MKIFDELTGLVSSALGELKTAYTIMKLESRLAAQSIFPLMLGVCLALFLLFSLWVSTLILIGYGIFLLLNHIFYSLSIVFIMNLVFLLVAVKIIQFNLRCMSFEKTRHYLSNKQSINNDHKTRTPRQTRVARKKITTATP